jgi:hypothetical protein
MEANEHIKITGIGVKRRWTLIYRTNDELVNSPFYGQLPGIDFAGPLYQVQKRVTRSHSETNASPRVPFLRGSPETDE